MEIGSYLLKLTGRIMDNAPVVFVIKDVATDAAEF